MRLDKFDAAWPIHETWTAVVSLDRTLRHSQRKGDSELIDSQRRILLRVRAAIGPADPRGHERKPSGVQGASLVEMTNLGLPVPTGFVTSTSVRREVLQHGQLISAGTRITVDGATGEVMVGGVMADAVPSTRLSARAIVQIASRRSE